MEYSSTYCTSCGQRGIPIPRKRRRECGHLKKLFCMNCLKEVNHVEISNKNNYSVEWFKKEFKYHNFDKNGNRILTFNQFKQKYKEE